MLKIYRAVQKRYNKIKALFFFGIARKANPGKMHVTKVLFGKSFILDLNAQSFSIRMTNVKFRDYCTIRLRKDGKLIIDENVFFNSQCSINCMSSITIGKDTLFGENVKLYDHNHGYKDKMKTIGLQNYTLSEIVIGERCWIGSNVVILKGVTIGDNVVVGANCVIAKDIPDNTVIRLSYQSLISQSY